MILGDEEHAPKEIQDFVRGNSDFEITGYICRGFNGEVYFGKRKKMGDEVVLKFYFAHPEYDETEEAVILQKIDHKNILKIYDLKFVPPYTAYFLSPKISGGDLQGIIDSQNISSKTALEIIAGILMGLTELHSEHKLVHRDLKPGNILFDLDSKTPIIADLGAVKKITAAHGHVTASKSTYYYLPPEAIIDNKYYYQSDIYQIGIIMYQLLHGFFPLESPMRWLNPRESKQVLSIDNWQQRLAKLDEIIGNKITKGSLIDLNSLPSHLDPAFKKVISNATNKDYKKRFANPSLFLKEIHSLLRNCPEYIKDNEIVSINHSNGKKYRITPDEKGALMLEKHLNNNKWQKDNKHNGSLESMLQRARLN